MSFFFRKTTLLTLLGLGIAIGGASHFISDTATAQASTPAPEKPAVHVEAAAATADTLSESLQAVGSLAANESVELRSEITGRVENIQFKDGQKVKAKDILFTLEDSVQKAELARAKANLTVSQRNVTRYSTLASKGFSSKMQLDESQAQLNLAKANVQLAEANLAKSVIRAPFDGTVGIRKVSLGDYVSPGEVLVNVDQIEKLKLQFTVPERYMAELKTGSEVEFTAEAQGSVYRSQVDAIESRISSDNRSIQVQAIVDNTDGQLYPGQFVTVTLPIVKKQAAVIVPDQALVPMGAKTFVFKVADGKAQKVEVQPGLRADSRAEILSGVAAGDMVVTAGQQKLQDGAAVRVSEPTPVSVSRMGEEAEP